MVSCSLAFFLKLVEVVSVLKEPAIFWLDAHYSAGVTSRSLVFGDTPISKELEVIFKDWKNGSVIVIDDAVYFNGTNNYPTIEEVSSFITKQNLGLKILVKNGSINIF